VAEGWIGEDDAAGFEAEAAEAVEAAVAFGRAAEFPSADRVGELVYA
jgi:hypothetical protein